MTEVDTFEKPPLDSDKDKSTPIVMQGQLAYLYKNKAQGIISNTLLSFILLGFFWFHFPQQHIALLIWVGLIITLSLVRFFVGKSFKPQRQYTNKYLTRWANRHVFFTSLLSTIWGLSGVVFLPTDIPHLTLLVTLYFSVLLTLTPTLAASRIAYYFQILVILAPTTISLLISVDNGNRMAGFSIFVMTIALLATSTYIHQLLFELQNAQISLQGLANTDQITNIANRRHFDRKFKDEWRRAMRERTPISLVLIDIDFFKKYNDSYGHPVGNQCLQAIAETLKNISHRPADLPARFSGGSFAVLLPITSQENAFMLANRLHKKINALNIEHSHSEFGHVTASIGVSCCKPIWDFSGDVPDEEQKVTFPAMLLTTTDNALYIAKKSGRNQVAQQTCGDHTDPQDTPE